VGPPPIESMIEGVTRDTNWILREQLEELRRVRGKRR
jgi:hypothetical protein